MYEYIFESPFSVTLRIYTGMELSDHMVILCVIFQGAATLFSYLFIPSTCPLLVIFAADIFQQCMAVFIFIAQDFNFNIEFMNLPFIAFASCILFQMLSHPNLRKHSSIFLFSPH